MGERGGRPRRADLDAAVAAHPDVPARELARLLGCHHTAIVQRRSGGVSHHLSHCRSEFLTTSPRRPVLRYHGGKWMLAPWIISHFPPHRVYTEAYGGAGSVLMRKPRAQMVEVLNDADGEIVNLFEVLRDPVRAARLAEALRRTPYSRREFRRSYEPTPHSVEQARRTCVRAFQGFGSDSASGAQTGFRANGNRNNAHPARDFTNYPDALAAFTARLQGVVIENRPAVEIIQQHDEPRTLHYVDPPYVPDSRSRSVLRKGKGYRHEMTVEQHVKLAQVLHACAGMVILSGYASDLYDRELYADWHRVTRATKADGGLDRVEVLWLNPAAAVVSPALAADGWSTEPTLFDASPTPSGTEVERG